MKPGDECRLLVHLQPVPTRFEAVVHLVNADGQPAAFHVDAMIEGFARWVPVIWRDGKAYTFRGTLVEVEAR